MKPVIGYDNLFVRFRDTITQSATSETGANLGNWLTGPDSAWQLPLSGQIVWTAVEPPTATPINYFAVARHNLQGVTMTLERFANGSWFNPVTTYTPPDNDAFLISFAQVTGSAYRVRFSSVNQSGLFMAVAAIGMKLELERGVFVGHDPITENERTVSVDNLSESGQFLGRKLIRMGASSSIDVDNISADWARDHWKPFRKHAQQFPFFWQWNPQHHDDEVSLCWQSGDPSLSNSGVGYLSQKGRLALSMPINGIVR